MKKTLFLCLALYLMAMSGHAQLDAKKLLLEAKDLYEKRELKQAYELCQKVLFEDSKNVEAYVMRGVILYVNGEYRPAFEDLQYAIAHHTKNPMAYECRGHLYKSLGKMKEAEADYDKAFSLNKQHSGYLLLRGQMRFALGDTTKAMADFVKARKMSPDDALVYNSFGQYYFILGQFASAKKSYEEALKHEPGSPDLIHFLIAECVLAQGQESEAESYYRKAIALEPKCAPAWGGLGMMKLKAGKTEDALADFRSGLEADSLDARCLGSYGWCLSILHQDSAALGYLDSALSLGSDMNTVFLKIRGDVKTDLGRYEDAIADYSRAIMKELQFAEAYMARGFARRKLNLFQKAEADFRTALELEPELHQARVWLAQLLCEMKKYEEAKENLLMVLKDDPENIGAWRQLGHVGQFQQDFQAAVDGFTKALELGTTDSAGVLYNRGSAYRELGKLKESEADISKCMAFPIEDAQLLLSVGYELNLAKRYTEALVVLEKSIAIDSTEAYAYNNRGVAKLNLGQYEAAILDFNKSIELKNDWYHWPPCNRADAERALGRYAEALADYNLSLSYKPDYVEALNGRGRTYEMMDDIEKAVADYQKVLEYKPDDATARANLERLER